MNFDCPKEDLVVENPCQRTDCAYNKEGYPKNCVYEVIEDLRDKPKNELKKSITKIYNVSTEELEASLKRVIGLICLSEYYFYIYGKDIRECKQAELNAIKIDPSRYEAWKPLSKKIPFAKIIESIEFLSRELR